MRQDQTSGPTSKNWERWGNGGSLALFVAGLLVVDRLLTWEIRKAKRRVLVRDLKEREREYIREQTESRASIRRTADALYEEEPWLARWLPITTEHVIDEPKTSTKSESVSREDKTSREIGAIARAISEAHANGASAAAHLLDSTQASLGQLMGLLVQAQATIAARDQQIATLQSPAYHAPGCQAVDGAAAGVPHEVPHLAARMVTPIADAIQKCPECARYVCRHGCARYAAPPPATPVIAERFYHTHRVPDDQPFTGCPVCRNPMGDEEDHLAGLSPSYHAPGCPADKPGQGELPMRDLR